MPPEDIHQGIGSDEPVTWLDPVCRMYEKSLVTFEGPIWLDLELKEKML